MQMDVDDLEGDVTLIRLTGDLDIKGSVDIDVRFAALTGARKKIVIDMSKVGFLASIGIRTLLVGGKAVARHGGKMVVLDPTDSVLKVLQTCGAVTLLTIAHGTANALSELSAP